MELVDQYVVSEDYDCMQYDCIQDVDDQYFLVLFFWYCEVVYDYQEDKDVVDCQGFFDQVVGQEFEVDFVGYDLVGGFIQVVLEVGVEQQGQCDLVDGLL